MNAMTNLAQLKMAMERSSSQVSDLAAIVYGTIEDMILQADITIPASAWAKNTDERTAAEGYMYKADIAVERLIEKASVSITLDVHSQTIAAAALMSSTAYIADGSVRFLAKNVPTETMIGDLDAIQFDE